MDAHLAPLLDASPHKLLHEHHTLLAQFAARSFDCPQPMAARALRHLAAADRLLRSVRLPQFLYRALRLFDKGAFHHFIYYVSQTQDCIAQIDSLFAGAQPAMEPELASSSQSLLAQLRDKCMDQLKARHHAPIEFLWTTQNSYNMKDMLAISAPIAAPANTSVG